MLIFCDFPLRLKVLPCDLHVYHLSDKIFASREVHQLEALGSSRQRLFILLADAFYQDFFDAAHIGCIFLSAGSIDCFHQPFKPGVLHIFRDLDPRIFPQECPFGWNRGM